MTEEIPDDVIIRDTAPEPISDPTLDIPVQSQWRGTPPNRLVVLGDSLLHGFQSGAVYRTELSVPAIIAYELGWLDSFRFPAYGGPGGLPFNLESLVRELERRFGTQLDWWEIPAALFAAWEWVDHLHQFWTQGVGALPQRRSGVNHNLAMYGWDIRDALSQTAARCLERLNRPDDDHGLFSLGVPKAGELAALRVYPTEPPSAREKTVFDLAADLGAEGAAQGADHGIETLLVFLGANNALSAVTRLKVVWSEDDGYSDLSRKGRYTVWRPTHFRAELAEAAEQTRKIGARHVIWCTVPHMTIPPVTRGIGDKVAPGSRYFEYYTRPWIKNEDFDWDKDPHLTAAQVRAVDSAIDQYNEAIVDVVRQARAEGRDWYLVDVAGLLDRLADRRYVQDPEARPAWWEPFPLPAELAALRPPVNSEFLLADEDGGRATGGLFSLDGVHPTTVGYGILAQEIINVMRLAEVPFYPPQLTAPRTDPVKVDFERLIRRDTLLTRPPTNLRSGLSVLSWADEALDTLRRALPF